MTVSQHKEYAALERLAVQQGWTIERRSKHVLWTNPQGETVTLSSTPGHNTFAVQKAQLEKIGLITSAHEWRQKKKALRNPPPAGELTRIDMDLPDGLPPFDIQIELGPNDDVDKIKGAIQQVQDQMEGDNDFAHQFYLMPHKQQELYIRAIASGLKPSDVPKVCVCGSSKPNAFGMLLHMKQCDAAERDRTERAAAIAGPPPSLPGTIPVTPPQPDPTEEQQVEVVPEPLGGVELFRCNECPKTFTTERGLGRHITMTHKTTVIRMREGEAPGEDDLDALLQLVTGGASIPLNMASLTTVNRWMEATKDLLAIVKHGSLG